MKLQDKVAAQIKGHVEIVCQNEQTGEIKRIGSNLIVDGLYSRLANLLGHLSTSKIANIAFGIGTTAPAVTDVMLTGVVTTCPVTVTYPSIYSVQFVASWAAGVSDIADVTEVGLLFSDSVLAARYVFAAMKKSVGWSWTVTWTLSYTP